MDVCTNINGPDNSIRLLMANLPTILSDLLTDAFEAVPDIEVIQPANDMQQLLDASRVARRRHSAGVFSRRKHLQCSRDSRCSS
jgi:hypothetical protein